MADKIVATWANDSVGITSQRVYRTLNEEPEVMLATLGPTDRAYVDATFKDTNPDDVAYRVTSVGTVGVVDFRINTTKPKPTAGLTFTVEGETYTLKKGEKELIIPIIIPANPQIDL